MSGSNDGLARSVVGIAMSPATGHDNSGIAVACSDGAVFTWHSARPATDWAPAYESGWHALKPVPGTSEDHDKGES